MAGYVDQTAVPVFSDGDVTAESERFLKKVILIIHRHWFPCVPVGAKRLGKKIKSGPNSQLLSKFLGQFVAGEREREVREGEMGERNDSQSTNVPMCVGKTPKKAHTRRLTSSHDQQRRVQARVNDGQGPISHVHRPLVERSRPACLVDTTRRKISFEFGRSLVHHLSCPAHSCFPSRLLCRREQRLGKHGLTIGSGI